jgi:hypothetical protein
VAGQRIATGGVRPSPWRVGAAVGLLATALVGYFGRLRLYNAAGALHHGCLRP